MFFVFLLSSLLSYQHHHVCHRGGHTGWREQVWYPPSLWPTKAVSIFMSIQSSPFTCCKKQNRKNNGNILHIILRTVIIIPQVIYIEIITVSSISYIILLDRQVRLVQITAWWPFLCTAFVSLIYRIPYITSCWKWYHLHVSYQPCRLIYFSHFFCRMEKETPFSLHIVHMKKVWKKILCWQWKKKKVQ